MDYEFTTAVDVEGPDADTEESRAEAWDILFDRLYGTTVQTPEDLKRVFRIRDAR